MKTTLRKFTFIFLTLVQLIAPLVHAHTGEKISNVGLHVPGLELLGIEQNGLRCQAIDYDHGIMVGIDAGIKDKKVNAIAESDNDYYVHQQSRDFNLARSPSHTTILSPPSQRFGRLILSSLIPRAPPVQ